MLLFFNENHGEGHHVLENEEFLHCTKVLRRQSGDIIHITDGKGIMAEVKISGIQKRSLDYDIIEETHVSQKGFQIHIAIAPTKQIERMEWFVEKSGELGVDEISFIQTRNSERTKLKLDRLEKKAISALKQSKGAWKTKLNPMMKFHDLLSADIAKDRFIAALDGKNHYLSDHLSTQSKVIILIGPEGDFSQDEILLADKEGFKTVTLGKKVLRTETAGLVAAQMVNTIHKY